jgi:hypothetical protein
LHAACERKVTRIAEVAGVVNVGVAVDWGDLDA